MSVLVTGGAGYIGSHTVIELIANGYEPIIVDNLCNSKKVAVERVEKIVGKKIKFYQYDLCEIDKLREIFQKENIDSCIHFAGLKAVGESCQKPLEYYQNNLISTLNLVQVMKEFGCKNLVFSSSATVYGQPKSVPILEDFPLSTTNPYGSTKLYIEGILKDIYKADNTFNIALLRYFNPIGAHKSGLIGEDPNGIPNNLMPYITQVAIGKLKQLSVFGDDYPTHDGTGVRDYIHVLDLARGHILALKKLSTNSGLVIYNLGTGKGYSVLDMVKAFENASGKKVPYVIAPRRSGDIAECFASTALAKEELGFECKYGLQDMCEDSWRWQSNNPNGYGD
ncbi:MAG: UDP-glucose 4-epimerase GalE [Clostridia bacterium]|nr:UDP-glucose 4-epimerase GalE [Clostridia bacterium]MDE7216201.1 UDP-glucose 4-epimerase GalE [Clostridia bacterium]MDE7336559.1 UDP-glucose 4-epimerase GalE [Clostridia bacterium]